MAFSISVSYDGKNSRDWYTELFYDVTDLNYMSMLTGVKYQEKIPNLTAGSMLQTDSCSVNLSGTVTMAEKTVSVCELMVMSDFCKKDLEATFVSELMTKGSTYTALPAPEEAFLLDTISNKTANDIQQLIWQGDVTGSSLNRLCDGFIKKFKADATVNVTSAATITSSNVLAQLATTVASLPGVVLQQNKRSNVIIFVSPDVAFNYKVALASQNSAFIQQDQPLTYLGYPIIETGGLPASNIVISTKDNLVFATDLINDWESLQVIDREKLGEGPNLRVYGRMKIGVEYKYADYIAWYHN